MSSRWKRPVVGVIVVVATATWIVVHERDSDDRTSVNGESTSRHDESTALAVGGPVLQQVDTQAVRVSEGLSQASESDAPMPSFEAAVAAGAITLEPNKDGGIEICVVRRGTHQPMAGAIVAGVDVNLLIRNRGFRDREFRQLLKDARRLARDAVFVRADEAGRALLPRRMFQMFVVAERDGMRGAGGAMGDSLQATTVEIAPPTAVQVQVLDATGQPRSGVRTTLDQNVAVTEGVDGIARLDDLELDNALWFDQRDGGRALLIAVDAPLADRPTSIADLQQLPKDPIELTLPPCGGLVLRVVDAEHRLIAAPGDAKLEWTDPKHHDEFPFEFPLDPSGETMLPCVELGQRFRFTATTLEHAPVESDIAGPGRPGEIVAIEVPIGSAHVVLVGRAVDGDGRVIAATLVRGRLKMIGADGENCERDVATRWMADGTFRCDWSDHQELLLAKKLRPVAVRWSAWTRPELQSKEFPFPEVPPSGEVDLGDVVFQSPPLLAHGVVVDDSGRPLPQTALLVKRRDPPDRFEDPVLISASGEDGAFELRSFEATDALRTGALPTDALIVEAIGQAGARSEKTPVIPGGDELRLVVTRRGSIAGSLRANQRPPGACVSIMLETPDGEFVCAIDARRIDADECFEFKDVAPGRYDVGFFFANEGDHGEQLVHVSGVDVKPGEKTRDPRLADVDPWAHVRFVAIEVSMPDGSTPSAVVATTLTAPKGSVADWQLKFLGAVARLPTTQERVGVAVIAPGCRPAIARDVVDRARVRLERAIPVRFVVGNLPEDLADSIVEQLSLVAHDTRFPWKWLEIERSFWGEKTLSIGVPLPGRYTGKLGLKTGVSQDMIDSRQLEPFVVSDSTEEQVVELKLAREAEKDR